MRSPLILCPLILAMLGWTTPGHAAPRIKTGASKVQQQQALGETPQKLESAEVDWQVVAIRQKGVDTCPQVPGWDSDRSWLAQTLGPSQAWTDSDSKKYGDEPSDIGPLKEKIRRLKERLRRAITVDPVLKELDRFCSYRKKTSATAGFPNPLPSGLQIAAKSRAALVPAGELDTGVSARILARHFLDQTSGMLPNQTVDLTGPARVRLVFIDTQQDSEDVPHVSGPSRHGYTLVHQARQLVCGDVGPCPVELKTRLALPHTDRDLPTAGDSEGGNLGLVEELAGAIVRAVQDWRQPGSPRHLILNLSVGWDELSFDGNGKPFHELDSRKVSRLRPDTKLVYEALLFARRSGALVIAAAGNRRGGMESKWPLLPAAWELRRPSCLPFTLGPKPVYAVGGVDWQGLPLSNYRHGGLPRRVAFGDHAVADSGNLYEPTAMYTGSSVSTAVVSSIAATVWQLRPELKPAEVMELISRSGDRLSSQADYYAWRNLWPLNRWIEAPHMRRLSLCRAVQWACADRGRCTVPSCAPWDSQGGAADLSILVDPENPAIAISPLPELRAATLPVACTPASNPAPRLFAAGGKNISDACPLFRQPDIVSQRWVVPQPDDPPCPGCSFIPPRSGANVASLALGEGAGAPQGYVFAVEIDSKWQSSGATIVSADLDVDRYAGGKFVERMTYAIPAEELNNAWKPDGTHRLHIKEAGDGGSLANCTATLNLKMRMLDGNVFSVQSPIYVDPEPPL